MSEPNEALLKEHLDAENAHDIERIMATYTASPVIELGGSRIEGTAAVREFHLAFGFGTRPGASFTDVHVAERSRHRTPDAIVMEQTLRGSHTGVWRGVAPTGRPISVPVCTVYVFEGGKLARENVYLDEGRIRHELTKASGEQAFVSSRDVILRTPAYAEATRFYSSVLGLPTTLEQDGLVGFETGAFQLFVERGAPHGAVFEMYARDVAAAKDRLVAAGCSVVEEDPSVPRCYIRDPFGFVFNVARR